VHSDFERKANDRLEFVTNKMGKKIKNIWVHFEDGISINADFFLWITSLPSRINADLTELVWINNLSLGKHNGSQHKLAVSQFSHWLE